MNEVLIVEIRGKRQIVALMYRPPKSDKEKFSEIIKKVQEILLAESSSKDIILLGDFNFPIIRWPSSRITGGTRDEQEQANLLLDVIEDNFLDQIVSEPTRKNNILDLVFTNSMSIRGTEVIKNSVEFSDHNTVISTFLTARKEEKGEEPINYHESDLPLHKIEE